MGGIFLLLLVFGITLGMRNPTESETTFTDRGSPQTVLLDARNGEKRDDWRFSLVRFTELGEKAGGALGWGTYFPRRADGIFLKSDFSFTHYKSTTTPASLQRIIAVDNAGRIYEPIRVQTCTQKAASSLTKETTAFSPMKPCEVSVLFDVQKASAPYALKVTYQERSNTPLP